MTGLTDTQRNNFNLMKELAVMTKPPAEARVEIAKKLIDNYYKGESEKIRKDWSIDVS